MAMTIPRADPLQQFHEYTVYARLDPDKPFRCVMITAERHYALQIYICARVAFSDFDHDPEKFLVLIKCDGVEYFNNVDRSMRGHLTGSSRPLPADRRMP